MTIINVKKHKGKIKGFVIVGHANYAEHGKDIVCNTISVLIQYIGEVCKELELEALITTNDGYYELILKESNKVIETALYVMYGVFLGLAEEYKNNVKIMEE